MIKLEMEVKKEGDVYVADIKYDEQHFCGVSEVRQLAMDRAFKKAKDYKDGKTTKEIVMIDLDADGVEKESIESMMDDDSDKVAENNGNIPAGYTSDNL